MRDGNSFPLVCVCFQVILANESIVLCKCSGKYIDICFSLKITFSSFRLLKSTMRRSIRARCRPVEFWNFEEPVYSDSLDISYKLSVLNRRSNRTLQKSISNDVSAAQKDVSRSKATAQKSGADNSKIAGKKDKKFPEVSITLKKVDQAMDIEHSVNSSTSQRSLLIKKNMKARNVTSHNEKQLKTQRNTASKEKTLNTGKKKAGTRMF